MLHLAVQRAVELAAQPLRRVDVKHVPLHEQRREERKPLNVIPVRVADEQVPFELLLLRHQRLTQRLRAGAAVEDQQRTIRGPHLDARGVAADRTVVGPGVGIEPRVPQKVTRTGGTLAQRVRGRGDVPAHRGPGERD